MKNWQKNLFLIWLSQFLAMGGYSMAMPFIPLFIKSRLGIAAEGDCGVGVALFNFLGMGMLAIAAPIWGNLADRFGRKLMLLRAAFISALLFPLMMFSTSLWMLIGIRVLASFFSGTVNAAQTLVASITPEERQGFALGTISTAAWSGHMLGYFLGGMVVDRYGFDAGFIICGITFFLSGLLVLPIKEHFVPSLRPKEKKRRNFRELLTSYSPGLQLLILLIFATEFMRNFEAPYLAMLVEQVSPPGKAAGNTGFVCAAAAAGGVLAGFTIGHLADKLPAKWLLPPLFCFAGAMVLGQYLSTSFTGIICFRFFAYLAAGGLSPVIQRLISAKAGPERRGQVFGVMQGFALTGVMLSALISGGVVYIAGVRGVFLTGALLLFLTAFPSVKLLSFAEKEESCKAHSGENMKDK